jgi:hypothetical protein
MAAKKPTTRKPTTRKPTTKDVVDTAGNMPLRNADVDDRGDDVDTEGNRIESMKDSAVDGDGADDTEGNLLRH